MALRVERAARRRGARLGSTRFAGLAALLYLAAGALATWPALEDANDSFLARADPSYGEASSGDHLQLGYALWLVGHQLGRLAAPWRDPYSFQPESSPALNLQGWLFGLPYWPVERAFGAVAAWNVFVLVSYVLAGGAACWWLRSLGLERGAALVGGLAFALAPYRVAQSTGHLLGPVSVLLPLALLGFERGRDGDARWLALGGAALVAVPLSGQLHLALGAIPFVLAYALVRQRARPVVRAAWVAAGLAAVAGVAVQLAVVHGSVASGGRSLREVSAFSADWSGLVSRHVGPLEEFVLLGWLVPLLALVGVAALVLRRSPALALLLALGVVVPALLALGTNLPLYEPLWHALPPLRYPRVPERLLPIACLALAALAAIAVDQLRGRAGAIVALVLVAFDLRAGVALYRPASADPDNRAYAALAERGHGRLVELPVFTPERQYGSVYLYYSMQAPRERPGGYSSVAPRSADRTARRLVPLNCGAWSPRLGRELRALGVRYVTVHGGLYADPAVPDCAVRAMRTLRRHGFRRIARDGAVTLYGHMRTS
jgi:hypothetical protein